MVTIAGALRQVKDDLPCLIAPALDQALTELPDYRWRKRIFNPQSLILLMMTQIMHGNTAINHLRHFSPRQFTAAAYCKARMKLPLTLIQGVTRYVSLQLRQAVDPPLLWRGHRLWYADGTSFSMPDTPELQAAFGQPGAQAQGLGFPVCTLMVLCNAAGLISKTLALPLRSHDASSIAQLHPELDPGDVLIYDRAGCSYGLLALLLARELHGLIRLHQKQIVSFRPGRRHAGQWPKNQRRGKPTSRWVRRLGPLDQLVEWVKPKRRPRWMAQDQYESLPGSITLRELRYTVTRKGFRTSGITLVTTLLDPEAYPKDELAQQYQGRWQIETNFRHLKQTMNMEILKCKTSQGVQKELAIFVLVYNLVRLVMLRASKRQRIPHDRVSFVDALRWLCHTHYGRQTLDLRDLITNPRRPDRFEPRVVKRRPKSFKVMTMPRTQIKKNMDNQVNNA